jgi:hypothetical protein
MDAVRRACVAFVRNRFGSTHSRGADAEGDALNVRVEMGPPPRMRRGRIVMVPGPGARVVALPVLVRSARPGSRASRPGTAASVASSSGGSVPVVDSDRITQFVFATDTAAQMPRPPTADARPFTPASDSASVVSSGPTDLAARRVVVSKRTRAAHGCGPCVHSHVSVAGMVMGGDASPLFLEASFDDALSIVPALSGTSAMRSAGPGIAKRPVASASRPRRPATGPAGAAASVPQRVLHLAQARMQWRPPSSSRERLRSAARRREAADVRPTSRASVDTAASLGTLLAALIDAPSRSQFSSPSLAPVPAPAPPPQIPTARSPSPQPAPESSVISPERAAAQRLAQYVRRDAGIARARRSAASRVLSAVDVPVPPSPRPHTVQQPRAPRRRSVAASVTPAVAADQAAAHNSSNSQADDVVPETASPTSAPRKSPAVSLSSPASPAGLSASFDTPRRLPELRSERVGSAPRTTRIAPPPAASLQSTPSPRAAAVRAGALRSAAKTDQQWTSRRQEIDAMVGRVREAMSSMADASALPALRPDSSQSHKRASAGVTPRPRTVGDGEVRRSAVLHEMLGRVCVP